MSFANFLFFFIALVMIPARALTISRQTELFFLAKPTKKSRFRFRETFFLTIVPTTFAMFDYLPLEFFLQHTRIESRYMSRIFFASEHASRNSSFHGIGSSNGCT